MTNNPARTIVVKIGGNSLGPRDTTFPDVVRLHGDGTRVIVVHGGGPTVTDWLGRIGVETTFVEGQRVTDEATLEVVTAVLSGLVNKSIVAEIQKVGGPAVGISGSDGPTVMARVRDAGTLGRVGDVLSIRPDLLDTISDAGMIPVVSPISREDAPSARLLNVNADSVAGALADAVNADRVVFMTDVPGVLDSGGEPIPALQEGRARQLIADGVIGGGMIPKVEACLMALRHTEAAQIIDGRQPGALLEALQSRAGTVVSRDVSSAEVDQARL